MNPTNGNAVTDPQRSSFSCDRHPIEQFSTFCPACLCERLTTLDNNSSNNTPTSSQRPSSVSTAIKSLFSSIKPTSELRRSKSYSASKNEALGVCFEPQRKSCDVRVVRSEKRALSDVGYASSSTYQKGRGSVKIESFVGNEPVLEEIEDGVVAFVDVDDDDDDGDEINKPVPDCGFVEVDVRSSEIVEVEEEDEEVDFGNLKPMKEHIELDYHGKKSVAGGGLRAAASVFGKKWNKWRRKQKGKKQTSGENSARVSVEKGIGRRYRETQSEVADYGFGRRSYDIDPRFSLDAGRISFDDPRYSVEEPRASWDGYVIGRRSVTRMAPMVSVMEDAPPIIQKPRNDVKVPLEESDLSSANENGNEPGGSAQTREYYSDSSSRARKSLDRSSSVRKTAAAVINDLKMVSDTKVSPTKTENLREERLETFELDNDLRDDCNSVLGFGERKQPRKPKRWSWRIWDFIHRRYVGNKDEEKCDSVNGVERSLSESWQDLRRERNEFKGTMLRSNSSVSWRNANDIGRSFDEINGNGNGNGKKKKDEFVLEKNRSGRDSSFNPVNNGFLGFYLTPLRRSGRRVGLDKLKPNNSLSIARSVLKL